MDGSNIEDFDLPVFLQQADEHSHSHTHHPTIRSTTSVTQLLDLGKSDVPILHEILDSWETNHRTAGFDPTPLVEKVAELLEKAMNYFLEQDPDPLDERHPSKTHPQHPYGILLKHLYRHDDFMHTLVVSYIFGRDNLPLTIAASRVLLSSVPGMDRTVFSDPDSLLTQIFTWAERSDSQVLKAYAMGLLASVMEVQETASKFREHNARLIPIALRRLTELKDEMIAQHEKLGENNHSGEKNETKAGTSSEDGPFANVDLMADSTVNHAPGNLRVTATKPEYDPSLSASIRVPQAKVSLPSRTSPPPTKRRKIEEAFSTSDLAIFPQADDSVQSNSNWYHQLPLLIGKHQVHPLTIEMHQRFILQYLTPTGEYQDLLVKAYEGGALPLILEYLDLRKTRDVRLTFDATRYVASLLVHRKFAIEFVQMGGVEALLKIPNGCLAAVGVATCLYYLAYSDDVMETFLSQRPENTIDRLVDYALWCVEHSYESGMASACMFFTHGVRFRPILERFDQRDGPRIIMNYLTTLSMMVEFEGNEIKPLTDDLIHTSMQTIRNVASCLKSYLSSHFYLKLEQIRRLGRAALPHGYGCTFPGAILHDTPTLKPMILDDEGLSAGVWTVACALRMDKGTPWRPVEDLRATGVARYMLHIVDQTPTIEIVPISGRHEVCKNAIEVLWMLATLPSSQLEYAERLQLKGHIGCSLLSHITELCGKDANFGETGFIALQILQLIVCAPPYSESKIFGSQTPGKSSVNPDRKSKNKGSSVTTDLLERMWDAIRNANGIMILTNAISDPPTNPSKDRARLAACRALQGIARNAEVRQLLSKLPIVMNNELQTYLRELVPSESRSDYGRFCKEAKKLIEVVTGRPVRDPKDLTQERMVKQAIVASTHITYDEQELLELIHSYLKGKGLDKAADQLSQEANLTERTSNALQKPIKAIAQLPSRTDFMSHVVPRPTLKVDAGPANFIGGITTTPTNFKNPAKENFLFATPATPITAKAKREARSTKSRLTKEMGSLEEKKTLDGVIVQYFKMQHSECAQPVSMCPPFSLLRNHRCPEVPERNSIPSHVVANTSARSVKNWNNRTRLFRGYDRFLHSRFRAVKTFLEQDEMYTAASFSIDDEHIIVGMYTGEVHWLNVESTQEESHTNCHHSAITHIEPSQDGSLLLTSSAFMPPYSSLWLLGESQEHLHDFAVELYTEFANQGSDRILGTGFCLKKAATVATVFDTETRTPIVKLWTEGEKMRYRKNVAHFSPDDSCILHDGRLWDIRTSARPLHTFDKLNSIVSGVFHPHGNEVIINSEVWDMRTYRLLLSVPTLDQCNIKFTSNGSIMYAIKRDGNREDCSIQDMYTSSFTTLDSVSYQQLSSVNVRRPILSLCLDHADQRVAVVEKTSKTDTDDLLTQESSAVKLYEIGKIRVPEEDIDDADEDAEPEVDDGNSDFSSSSESSDSSSDDDDDDQDEDDEDEDDVESTTSVEEESSDEEGWEVDGEASAVASGEAAEDQPMEQEESENEDGDEEEESDGEENDESDDSRDILEAFMDEEEDDDETFQEEEDSRGHGSSTIVLNPHLRRARRRAASERDPQ
ncbi:unnamed protein product, partial [Mesorhabditis belari]|uniref:LisH domain-containing protein n=1 Tax=Mesorhabditis belari TaxID=2138241 RepID=A0AAF3FC02_9BILA